MIDILIDDSGFTVQGHANYDERGKDIVCAGVSSLSQSIAMGLKMYCNATVISTHETLFVAFNERMDTGYTLLDTLEMGLKNIEKDFPKHLRLTIIRSDESYA